MNEDLDAIIETIDEERWPRELEAFMTPLDRAILRWYAAKVKPPLGILEIGTFKGGSCLELRRGAPKEIPIWTVDAEDSQEENVAQIENVHFFLSNSHEFDFYESTGISPDLETPLGLLFIDGEHKHEDEWQDLVGFSPLVCSGGYLIVHDFGYCRGVARAVFRFLVSHRDFGVELMWPEFDWDTLRGTTESKDFHKGYGKRINTTQIVLRKD